MAFQLPATYTAPPTTSGYPTFVVNLPSRETASIFKSSKAASTRYTSDGRMVRVKLPHSPSPPTTQWSLDTPEQDEDDDDDPSFVGSESEHSSDEDGEESSDDDNDEEFDDEIPEEEVASLLLEAKELSVPIFRVKLPHSPSPSTTQWSLDTPEQDEDEDDDPSFAGSESEHSSDEDGEESSDDDDDDEELDDEIPEEEVTSLLLEAKELSVPISIPHIPAARACPGTVAAERDDKDSKETNQASLSKSSRKSPIEYLNEIYALEKQVNNLTTENSLLKKARDSTKDALAKERESNQRDLLDAKDLYKMSQKTVETLRKDISTLTSKVSELATENSSLKEGQEATEDARVKEKKRGQQDLQDAKGLYEGSQRTVEELRKEVNAVNSYIGELTTKESSLKNSLESTQDALIKEKMRSRELEIRLEERVALGIKTHDSPETKLEKYLREELDKSHRLVLLQQKDFEKLRGDHTRLQITNATLESQVKHIEVVNEELSRASNREFQELAERNSDLSNQLHHTRVQFEQLKAGLAAMEKENEGEASKSKFSLRDIYRRPKREPSRLLTPPTDK